MNQLVHGFQWPRTFVLILTLAFMLIILAPQPSHATNTPLTKLWQIGGDSEDPNQLFGVIIDLALDHDGYAYVVDQQLGRISLFAPDGTFVRTIGRQGDGPGEFRRPYRVFISPANEACVLSGMGRRIDRFNRNGEFLGSQAIPADSSGIVPRINDVKTADGAMVFLSVIRENSELVLPGERTTIRRLHARDNTLQEVARYHDDSDTGDDARPVWSERPRALRDRWDVGPDQRVYVATSFNDYEVTVFAPDGTVDQVLTRDYDHRQRSKQEKQAVLDWATVNPNGNLPGTTYEIEDHDKDIMALHCRDDGSLWVLTSRGFYDRPEGSLGVFDVFDGEGQYVGEQNLMGDGDPARDRYYFHGDHLYVVTCFKAAIATMVGAREDNRFSAACEEPMSVICNRLGAD